jgi:hypothetical protein
MDWVKRYYAELTVEKEMFWLDGPKKRLAAYDYFSHRPEKMLEFFGKYVRNPRDSTVRPNARGAIVTE